MISLCYKEGKIRSFNLLRVRRVERYHVGLQTGEDMQACEMVYNKKIIFEGYILNIGWDLNIPS